MTSHTGFKLQTPLVESPTQGMKNTWEAMDMVESVQILWIEHPVFFCITGLFNLVWSSKYPYAVKTNYSLYVISKNKCMLYYTEW